VRSAALTALRSRDGDRMPALYEELLSLRQIGDMTRWFRESVIEPMVMTALRSRAIQRRQVVDAAVDFVGRKYMENRSLEMCADSLKVYPYTLSRAFKHLTGSNFVDYLREYRIGKSKEA
jgi:AraC-like DNA-binding protein